MDPKTRHGDAVMWGESLVRTLVPPLRARDCPPALGTDLEDLRGGPGAAWDDAGGVLVGARRRRGNPHRVVPTGGGEYQGGAGSLGRKKGRMTGLNPDSLLTRWVRVTAPLLVGILFWVSTPPPDLRVRAPLCVLFFELKFRIFLELKVEKTRRGEIRGCENNKCFRQKKSWGETRNFSSPCPA